MRTTDMDGFLMKEYNECVIIPRTFQIPSVKTLIGGSFALRKTMKSVFSNLH